MAPAFNPFSRRSEAPPSLWSRIPMAEPLDILVRIGRHLEDWREESSESLHLYRAIDACLQELRLCEDSGHAFSLAFKGHRANFVSHIQGLISSNSGQEFNVNLM